MAEEGQAAPSSAPPEEDEHKCPECPLGLPAWMATFSDLVTLLLTFFVLLLSFAKTESAKYEAALGSIRDAFGGNVYKKGEVIQRGKSPDDSPSMMESQQPVKPFPIEFLTMEGILNKYEVNRASDEDLGTMKNDLKEFDLSDDTNIYEIPEGIKVQLKDKIYFKKGSIETEKMALSVYKKLIKLLSNKKWTIFIQGHSERGEVSIDGKMDAFSLSSVRAAVVARSLIRQGVSPKKITTVFYGDTRPDIVAQKKNKDIEGLNRRVEFIIRKSDLGIEGHKVDSH